MKGFTMYYQTEPAESMSFWFNYDHSDNMEFIRERYHAGVSFVFEYFERSQDFWDTMLNNDDCLFEDDVPDTIEGLYTLNPGYLNNDHEADYGNGNMGTYW